MVKKVRESAKSFVVDTRLTEAGKNCAVIQSITYPKVVIELEKPVNKPVTIQLSKSVHDC